MFAFARLVIRGAILTSCRLTTDWRGIFNINIFQYPFEGSDERVVNFLVKASSMGCEVNEMPSRGDIR